MTALSLYFKEKGYEVTGSDVSDVFSTDETLARFHIPVFEGFDENHILKNYDLVIVTGAHGGIYNIEAKKAKKMGLKVLMHGQALGDVMKEYRGISISGTHGKTTTSSLIASLLTHAGEDPSYVVGTSDILDLSSPGHCGSGEFFVAEADEYMTCPGVDKTPRFLWQHPEVIVITGIEYDHPDAYSDIGEVEDAFGRFIRNLTGKKILIACIDNPSVVSLLKKYKGTSFTYGFSEDAMYKVGSYEFVNGKASFDVFYNGKKIIRLTTSLAGKHNILNVLAASVAAHSAGISWEEIQKNIHHYKGSRRRFEFLKEKGGFRFYDDYAHHPSEIRATLSGARSFFPDSFITVVFQPHTYSRTKSLFSEFARSFADADKVLIAPIYASAREKKDEAVSSELLVAALRKENKDAVYVSDASEAIANIENRNKQKHLVITMGAGDIYTWQGEIWKKV